MISPYFFKNIPLNLFLYGFILFINPSHVPAQAFRGVTETDNLKTPKVMGKTYAIVIGITDYALLKDLKYADRDAIIFSEFLEENLGVPKNNIKLFLNKKATAEAIIDEIYQIKTKIKPNDLVYIYFAGHGDIEAKLDDDALLLLYDSFEKDYYKGKDYIELSKLQKWLSGIVEKKAQVVFIADACRSGELIGGKEGQQKTAAALISDWKNQTKILSCQPEELSLEADGWGGGRGLFSFFLVKGLKGEADADHNSLITLFELQNYLQKNVREESIQKKQPQTPIFSGNYNQILSIIKKEIDSVSYNRGTKVIETQMGYKSPLPMSGNYTIEEEQIAHSDNKTQGYFLLFKMSKESKMFFYPKKSNAYYFLKKIKKSGQNEELLEFMKRGLASDVQEEAMKLINDYLEEMVYLDLEECKIIAKELKKAKQVIGKGHFLNTSLDAKALFLEAIVKTWRFNKLETLSPLQYRIIRKNSRLLEKSLQLEPNAPYTYYQLGFLYMLDEKYKEAEKAFKKYLIFLPNNAIANYNLGLVYYKLENYENALKFTEKALQFNPKFRLAFRSLGNTYEKLKEPEKAKIYFQKAQELEPK